jgi:protein-S-isoprenylcysteine O-methyltransferase Ste14
MKKIKNPIKMEDKDRLKEILGKIVEVNEPIDLEGVILKAIQKQESLKLQIARYKAKGIKALIVSGFLIVVLGILFSFPSNVRTVEHSIVTYTSIILILIVLFLQLEMGGTKIFDNLKNNLS